MKYCMLIVLTATLFFVGCESGDPYEKERLAIENYKQTHNITAEPLSSGLYYIETKAGTGASPAYGSKVRVKYKGTFVDGSEFDSGTFDFLLGLGRVIAGWDEGIGYMKEGGKAILIIPSDLGYGPNGSGSIPGYTPLIFDVELIDIF
ncbi:MAG: FKBP-type peptidyl-prolyl cis-trans isomerase [Bacteroidales bacterium]